MSVKIFQIGFNKCGTSTLAWFFKSNGVPTVHWAKGDIARRIEAARERGEDPLGFYRDVRFFSDMTYTTRSTVLDGAHHFDYIHRFYPDALFILNTRDPEAWINSRLSWTKYKDRYKSAMGFAADEQLVAHWRAEWRQHHARVQAFFADKPGQLLVFDIEKDGPQKIADFVRPHYKLDLRHYEVRKVSSERAEKRAGKRARFMEQLGLNPREKLAKDDPRRWSNMKRERRLSRAAENEKHGKYLVKRTLGWRIRLALEGARGALRKAFG